MAKFALFFVFIFCQRAILFDSVEGHTFATVYNEEFLAKITSSCQTFEITDPNFTSTNNIGSSSKNIIQSNNNLRSVEEGNSIFENGVKNLSAYRSFKELSSPVAVIISGCGRHGIYGAVLANKLIEEGVFVVYISTLRSSSEEDKNSHLPEKNILHEYGQPNQRKVSEYCKWNEKDNLLCLGDGGEYAELAKKDPIKTTIIEANIFFDSCQIKMSDHNEHYISKVFRNVKAKTISIGLPLGYRKNSGLEVPVFVNFAKDFYGRTNTRDTGLQHDFLNTEIVIVRIEKFFYEDIKTISNLKLTAKSITIFTPNYNSIEVSKEITNEYFKLHPLSVFGNPKTLNGSFKK